MQVKHTLNAIYDENSLVLILGSMPSTKSRELGFYYAHPQNRFWKTLSTVYEEPIGVTIEEKIAFLKKHHIALFDVIKTCDMTGSSDSSIKNPIPNNLKPILKNSKIHTIFTTGNRAYQLYQKYCYPKTNIQAIKLPSTSPANCKKGIDLELYHAYLKIRKMTENEK